MKITPLSIPDVWILEPQVHGDDRGYFMETFRQSHFKSNGVDLQFVQDNQSRSTKETLRGLHYQFEFPQGKLARILSGEVFDVAVDLRQSSPTFGQWVGEILSEENKKQLWVPPGFAHGFYVLSDMAEFEYKCTDYYHPEDEYSLLWSDPTLSIDWPLLSKKPLLAERDQSAPTLNNVPLFP